MNQSSDSIAGVFYSLDRELEGAKLVDRLKEQIPYAVNIRREYLIPGRSEQKTYEQITRTAIRAFVFIISPGFNQDAGLVYVSQYAMKASIEQQTPVIPVTFHKNDPEPPGYANLMSGVEFHRFPYEIALARLIWGITGIRPPTPL